MILMLFKRWLMIFKRWLMISNITTVMLLIFFPTGFFILVGMLIGIFCFGIYLMLWKKNELSHDPNNEARVTCFIEVAKDRAAMITRGNQPLRVIHGGKAPVFTTNFFGIWWAYQFLVFKITGLYPYVPYFTKPIAYDLSRYRMEVGDGTVKYVLVLKGEDGYRSNHVRTAVTTWPFFYKGIDINKIPFEVYGSLQYHIDKQKIEEVFYATDSWNTLLDQATNAIIRGALRTLTIDDVLGKIPSQIWVESDRPEDFSTRIGDDVLRKMREYSIESKRLLDFGINIDKVDFTDFKCELDDVVQKKLFAAIIGREAGRAADLLGQGTAAAQKYIRDIHGDGKGASAQIIWANALTEAGRNGNTFEVLLAALTGKQMKGVKDE